MISMPLVGEVKAGGKTPKELEKDLTDLYSTQLLSKEVTVEMQSSQFPVYVTGSVLRAGLATRRPISGRWRSSGRREITWKSSNWISRKSWPEKRVRRFI